MWLLGAGASSSAGVPTATNLIAEFKRILFCSAQRISIKNYEDLLSPAVQRRLATYFAGEKLYPSPGSPDEYARFFELAYPNPSDRRTFLDAFLVGAKPSYGHMALGALMATGKARLIWTTNFDRLVEDAAAHVMGTTSKLTVATTDTPKIAITSLNEGRWPLLCKIHGDFQSSSLKNSPHELQRQDAEIRNALVESGRRFGLITVGYSGRDESVMNALSESVRAHRGFPAGLFWFHRPDGPPLGLVNEFLKFAKGQGTETHLIEVETFDELLSDILKQVPDIPEEILERLQVQRPQISDVPIEPLGTNWPVIRTNALPVASWPSLCRRIVCDIGGTKEVREAAVKAGGQTIVARSKSGVIGFGSDSGMRKAFGPYGITEFDCHSVEAHRLSYESTELGLLRDAMAIALERSGPFCVKRRRNSWFMTLETSAATAEQKSTLKRCVNDIHGVVPKTNLHWSEAVRLKLEFALGKGWLLLEPTIFVQDSANEKDRRAGSEFVRERLAVRYNRQWNSILDAWIYLIMNNAKEKEIKALDINDGLNAKFTLSRVTGFSRRSSGR